jgi:hypothetical protein
VRIQKHNEKESKSLLTFSLVGAAIYHSSTPTKTNGTADTNSKLWLKDSFSLKI